MLRRDVLAILHVIFFAFFLSFFFLLLPSLSQTLFLVQSGSTNLHYHPSQNGKSLHFSLPSTTFPMAFLPQEAPCFIWMRFVIFILRIIHLSNTRLFPERLLMTVIDMLSSISTLQCSHLSLFSDISFFCSSVGFFGCFILNPPHLTDN